VWVLLDLQNSVQLGLGARGTEEQGILAAAAFAAQGLAQNRRLGLAAYSREPRIIPPAWGKNQQWKILRALALVRADGDKGLAVALADINRIVRRGSALIVITPSGQTSWLANLFDLSRRGISCTIILLDRDTFGDHSERTGVSDGLRKSLRQYGFQSHVIREGQMGRPLDIEDRRGYWEFRVTGTGKVVTVKDPFEG
jgi:uncharacterized protein (DUF58 family)